MPTVAEIFISCARLITDEMFHRRGMCRGGAGNPGRVKAFSRFGVDVEACTNAQRRAAFLRAAPSDSAAG